MDSERTDESTLVTDSLVPLMYHDPSDLESLILIQITPKERTQSVIIIYFRNSKQKHNLNTTEFNVQANSWWYHVTLNTRYFEVFLHINFMPVCLPKFKLCGNMKWIGELDIIMQRDSANLLYKKVQNKRGEQVNFVYHFVLEHRRGLVRPASLRLARKTG